MHVDIPKSKETLALLYAVSKDGIKVGGEEQPAEFEVIFAHNYEWEEQAKQQRKFWPGKL